MWSPFELYIIRYKIWIAYYCFAGLFFSAVKLMNLKNFPNIEKLAEPREKVKVLRAGFLGP